MKKISAILLLWSGMLLAEPVEINKADAETISKALVNIGPKKAQAIVEYRNQNGSFKTIKDLENVKGIGAKTAALIEKDVVFTEVGEAKKPEKTEKAISNKKP